MIAAERFMAFVRERLGVEPPREIAPGKFRRFPTNNKPNDDAGFAKLFPDGEGGVCGDFRTGRFEVWQARDPKVMTEAERQAWKERIELAKREAEAEREREQAEAAARAKALLEAATGDTVSHPYVIAKGGLDFGPRARRGAWSQRGWDDALLLPILRRDGSVQSVEAINADGQKDFLRGGRVGAGLYPLGRVTGAERVLVGEGAATVAAALASVQDYVGAAALSAGNLVAAARLVRELAAPGAEIVVLADDDRKPDGSNPGLRAATEAARLVGARLAVPDMAKPADFWDLWHERGPEAVARAIGEAKPPVANGPSPSAPPSEPRIVALEIGELLQRDFPPMEALLSPWLRKQYLSMVFAKRGVGKTHFGLHVAYAVAGGGGFLGWRAEKPRRVLYIDGEMPGSAIKERLAAIVKSSPEGAEPPEGYFRIITPDVQDRALPDLGKLEGQAEIGELLGDAELIVLDNLSTLMRSGVENEGESWLPMAAWALARRREGRAVLFVHHAGKAGTQRGSSRREDLLDVVISLRHPADYVPENGAQFVVRFEKARGLHGDDVREIEAKLTQDANGGYVWTWRAADSATRDRVVELVGLGMGDAEIAAELGVARSTVYRARKKAEDAGLVRPRDGKRAA